jgi:hypothetical protein
MRKTFLAVAVVAMLGALVACSTLQVNSDYDRTVDFAAYTTFDVLPAPELANPLVYARVSEAVEAELIGKGLRREAGSAALLVALHGRLSKQTQIDTATYGYGWGAWGGYWNSWGYGGMGTATTTVREVPVGTLIVDLVDAKEKRMIWQATASDTLDPNSSPEMKDYRVREAVKKMFAGFPPVKK